MKRITYLAFTLFIILSLYPMIQDCFATQWAKTYGVGYWDRANFIQQTTDGGYIVGGCGAIDESGLTTDLWILKLDREGNVSWQKSSGYGNHDYVFSIQQTTDGGYIVAGYFQVYIPGYTCFRILKLDHSGNISWDKSFGNDDPCEELAYSIQQTTDGGYIVAGDTYSSVGGSNDMWILKLGQNGTVTWQKTYGGSDHDYARSIQQTTDGGYIVAGYTSSFGAGSSDFWILKLDSGGNISWQKTYGGINDDWAYSIKQTTDGGYIVSGRTGSFGAGSSDFWILKLDSGGNISWQKTYGGESWDIAYSMQQTTDGGYIVAGDTESFGAGYQDVWILKLDSGGNISWQKTYGGSYYDYARSIQQTTDGGYIVAGRTNSFGARDSMWILKLDSSGDINNAHFIGTSLATVGVTTVSGVTSTAIISSPSFMSDNIPNTPQDTSAEIDVQCFAPDWFFMEPPSHDKLNGVWGYLSSGSNHQFYAVGKGGRVHHFDGTSWSGTGTITSYDLNGIWGSSGSDIYTVGDNSTIFHYDSGWTDVSPGLFVNDLNDLWGSASDDVYVVGDGGKIAHYDGTDWSEVTSPTTDKLNSIWGSSAIDYHAVGEGGRIIRYNGSWSVVTSPTSNDLSKIWGSASDNIYAVGKLGTIIHYDGTSWSDLTATESPTSANLKGIWGSSNENIFAVGEHGTILYYDGVSWQKMDSGVQDRLISTFGTLNPRVMVVGYDGNILNLGGPSVQGRICNSCTGEAINQVSVTFDQGGIQEQTEETDELGLYPTLSSQGGSYPLLFTAAGYIQKEITVDLPNNSSIVDHATYLVPSYPDYEDCLSGTVTKTVLIGTIPKENKRGVQNMLVKLYQNTTEIDSTVTDVGGNYHFTGLTYGTYKVELVITGSECSALPSSIYTDVIVPTDKQYNFELSCPENPPSSGACWSEMTYPTGIDEVLLHAIWGSSATNVFSVGDSGTIIHYDGSWDAQTSGTENNLKGIWGSSATDVYAVGEAGTVLKTTDGGDNWSPMTSNTANGLNAIWGGSGSDIFAVGDSGTIVHYDGTDWVSMASGTDVKLLSVWGNSGSDVYAMGNSHKETYWKRTVIRYDGTSWSDVETGNGVTLMSSWGSGTDDVTATGSFGSILRYDGTDWRQIGGPTEKTLNAMWGASSDSIFAVGFKGVIAHYDGTDWRVRQPDDEADQHDLYGIWGHTATEVYAVGDKGTILAYTGDLDGDGEPDSTDNCPDIENLGQANSDSDSHGDACDNCPNVTNEDQANSDHDTLGNACDNCPFTTNEGQEDVGDGDGVGDACDNCPDDSNPGQEDNEHDGIGDVCDNCPDNYNPGQEDNYPPGGNDCGDVCECEGDFEPDGDVDGTDALKFKTDFFRKNCAELDPCNGDFECDGDVDGTDAVKFKADFFRKDCPSCTFSCF